MYSLANNYRARVLGIVGAVLGCGTTEDAQPALALVDVSPDSCPALSAQGIAEILQRDMLRATPGSAHRATIWLRKSREPELPNCGTPQRSIGCEARDAALELHGALNSQQLTCILQDGFGFRGQGGTGRDGDLRPVFWEEPARLTSGEPVAAMLAFESGMTWELAQQLARHPYVDRVEPVIGDASTLIAHKLLPIPTCPTERDPGAPAKLTTLTSLRGAGRKPVIIELREAGYLPAQVECPDGAETCDAWTFTEWERYLVNTRQLACVRRAFDFVATGPAATIPYAGFRGSPLTKALPPWGTPAVVQFEFARALTRSEAEVLAAHPYVKELREGPGGTEPTSQAGCPLNTDAPVPKPECNDARESSSGKWTLEDEQVWRESTVPIQVTIQVRNGGKVCPAPACPPTPNPCPERELTQAYLGEWNWQSQSCVRKLISDIGGSATDERFWLISLIGASLTWPQIQEVGSHPHVATIQSTESTAPPP